MARILGLQQKYPEIGRIRAGRKTQGGRQPMEALENWRFTSRYEDAINAIAGLYGGSPHPWDDREGEWEVFAQANSIEVQLPGDPLFVAYELWGSGGNLRRCDGETCVVPVQDPEGGHLDSVPCVCEERGVEPGEDKSACSVTVRLKVVMPSIPGIGIWMLTSGSIYAAMELPAVCDLLDGLRLRSGILIPCRLDLQYREEKRPYEKFTRKYHVPTLQVDGSITGITRAIQSIEDRQSIAPTAPGKPAPALAAPAPAPARGLPPAPGGPPPGSEAGHLSPRPRG